MTTYAQLRAEADKFSVYGDDRHHDAVNAHKRARDAATNLVDKAYHSKKIKEHHKAENPYESKELEMKTLKQLKEWNAEDMIKQAGAKKGPEYDSNGVLVHKASDKSTSDDTESKVGRPETKKYETGLDTIDARIKREALMKMKTKTNSRIVKNLKDSNESVEAEKKTSEQLDEVLIPQHVVQKAARRLGKDISNPEHHAVIANALEKHHGVTGVVKPKEVGGNWVARGGNPTV